MAKLIRDMDIRILQQPTLFVLHNGVIVKANNSFCQLGGWSISDLVGQSISTIIDERLISVELHNALIQKYKFNTNSKIIGKSRILPIKTESGEKKFFSVQILPLGDSKSWAYLCFISSIKNTSLSQDPVMKSILLQRVSDQLSLFEFQQKPTQDTKFLSLLKEILATELSIIIDFIKENHHRHEVWEIVEDLILNNPYGAFADIYKVFVGEEVHFDYEERVLNYINIICWKLIYPEICSEDNDTKKYFLKFSKKITSCVEDKTGIRNSGKGKDNSFSKLIDIQGGIDIQKYREDSLTEIIGKSPRSLTEDSS